MKEPDWKIFKKIKDGAIEKYCKISLAESKEVLSKKREKSQET